jgi:hypothetical protein
VRSQERAHIDFLWENIYTKRKSPTKRGDLYMKLYANLHLHSTHSDGPYTPEELVTVAKKEGYRAVALSDHDTITGCPLMKAECEKQGMEFIFACEFTAKNPDAHIVGFEFDPEYPEMKEYLRLMSERETYKTKTCFEWAVEKGDIQGITWEEVVSFNKGVTWLCNNHVFEAMKAKGLIKQSEYMNFFTKNYEKQHYYNPYQHQYYIPNSTLANELFLEVIPPLPLLVFLLPVSLLVFHKKLNKKKDNKTLPKNKKMSFS